jgi:hypothetical protein
MKKCTVLGKAAARTSVFGSRIPVNASTILYLLISIFLLHDLHM